jgi:hypothetical protein
MEDALIQILESFKYPVYRQGSMSDEERYPETFITFWNNDSPDHAHYDNTNYGTSWNYNVFVYSSNPEKVYELLSNIRTALKAASWVVPSQGMDVNSDEATHTGRTIEVYYLET